MSAATDKLRDEIAAQILAALDYRMDPHGAVWECKVGGTFPHSSLPPGSDSPMRDAVERAYRDITGQEAEFCFSGWGAALSPNQRDVVENRVRETWQERDAVVAFLDRYAAAIRAEERERAAGLVAALDCAEIGMCAVGVPHPGERATLQLAVEMVRDARAAYAAQRNAEVGQ